MIVFALFLVCVDLVGKMYHVTTLAKDLHILPVKFQILQKILLTVFKCLHGNA